MACEILSSKVRIMVQGSMRHTIGPCDAGDGAARATGPRRRPRRMWIFIVAGKSETVRYQKETWKLNLKKWEIWAGTESIHRTKRRSSDCFYKFL
jgi:hypothetical protein